MCFVACTILEYVYLLTCKRFLNECDGVLMPSSHSWEHTSLIQMEEWLKSLHQETLPLYVIGPLLHPGYGRPSVEDSVSEQSQGERDVQVFLKEMQANYGERSVFFVYSFKDGCHKYSLLFQISFGTVFWPTIPGYIDEVIQVLIDKEVPFVSFFLSYSFILHFFPLPLNQILCHPSPFAQLSEEFVNNVKFSGLGFLTTWAPQQYILSHPV